MKYVFVHGLGQDSSSWNNTISFIKNDIQWLNPNLFELLEEKDVTYSNLYFALSKYLKEIDEPVYLVGLSLGAVLALNFAMDHPKQVHSLVLIAPQYKMPKLLLSLQNIIFRLMPESSFQKLGCSKNDFLKLIESMKELDFTEQMKNVTCQTLVLCGEKDRINKMAAEKLAKILPNGKFQIVSGAGHEVNMDVPHHLAFLLDDFFK